MLYLRKALKNIKSYWQKSVLTIAISFFIVLLLSVYIDNWTSYRNQLNNLRNVIPVFARILNLNGSQEVNLDIKDEIIRNLQNSKYVKNAVYTVRLKAGVGDFPKEDWIKKLNIWVLGINSQDALSGIKQGDITWIDGENETFFLTDQPKCIVSNNVLKRNGWIIGDEVPICYYYYSRGRGSEVYLNPLITVNVKIVGSMDTSHIISENKVDMVIPIECVRTLFAKQKIPFSADSASFEVSNPLKLNEFKQEMKKLGLVEVSPLGKMSYDGFALSVNDSVFIASATKLCKEITLLSTFFPCVIVLLIAIGYISSILLMQGRKEEIAILRSLGLSIGKCFKLYFLEYSILMLICTIIAISVASISVNIRIAAMSAIVVNIGFLCGAGATIIKMVNLNVMDALTKID